MENIDEIRPFKDEKFDFNSMYSQKNPKFLKYDNQRTYQDRSIFPSTFSLSQNNNNGIFCSRLKIKPKMFLGNQQVFLHSYQDSLPIRNVKKHLDEEYLDKFRYEYNFVPTPPRDQIEIAKNGMALILSQEDCIPKPKLTKFQKQLKENSENRKRQYQYPNIKKNDIAEDDDLPIALRRTRRPTTKPLRFWLGEKIIYKIDKETGCYTKSCELKVDDNDDF